MNPVPEIESELTVAAAVPLEVTVTDLVTAVPTETFPNVSELVLSVRAGATAFNCIAKLFEDEFALADTETLSDDVTEATDAVKDAVVAPDATAMLEGTVTALALLESVTLWTPADTAELSATVQEVEPFPVKEPVEQDNALTEGAVEGAGFDPRRLIVALLVTDP